MDDDDYMAVAAVTIIFCYVPVGFSSCNNVGRGMSE